METATGDKGIRDSFIFYRSFQEAIDGCSKEDQLVIYKAIANYALDRIEPELSGVAKVVWVLIKPQLDANWKRFHNGCKGAEFGVKGGAPKGNKNAYKGKTTPKQPQVNPLAVEKSTPNNNVNDNVNNNDNCNVNVEIKAHTKSETKRFTKPSIDEIEKYISENSYSVNAQSFYDYYESNGWMVGRNKMKDWKAAIRKWEHSEWNNKNKTPKLSFEMAGSDNREGEFTTTL